MSDDATHRVQSSGHPVRSFAVEVISGADAGARLSAEADEVAVGTAEGNDLALTDSTVSRYHLTLARRGDRVRVTDHGSTNGTIVGSVLLRGTFADVAAGAELALGSTKLRIDDGRVVMVDRGPKALGELEGTSAAMRSVFATAIKVAATDAPVLVLGESGTGKELLARAIHDESARTEAPFVTVDCAALAPSLFSSELFGHERGAFTGADRRYVGAFERAQGGTIFLDEIGELPAEIQAALLGVLERRRVRRLGGTEEIPLDVRVVSATHRDLLAEVNASTFRLDLFYRLAIVRITMPSLRDRPEDIPTLVRCFLEREGSTTTMEALFDEASLAQLARHAWPGNVRELKNVVLGTLALGAPPELVATSVGSGLDGGDLFREALALPYRDARRVVLDAFERGYLENLLAEAGSVRQAAKDAKMDRKYLTELLRRHGIR